MRRKFIAFLVIIVVFAATGAILCGELVTGNSRVQFTKDVKAGDESVLPDATFKAAFYYDHDYYWTTYMPLNNSDETITQSGKYAPVEEENRYSYLAELSTFNYCGASGVFIPLDETDYGTDNISNVYGDMLSAVSEEAGNDFETETVVNLRDYYDSYRFYFNFLDYDDGSTLYDEFEKVNDALNDYLYIPLPDESNVLVNMEKDSDGRLISYSIDSAEGDFVTLNTLCCKSPDNNFFFSFAADGEDADFGSINGGLGVYMLQSERKESSTLATYYFDYENIKTIYSAGEDEEICDMVSSYDGSEILLVSKTDDGYFLTVIDGESGDTVQREKIRDDIVALYENTETYDGIITLTFSDNESVLFYREDDGWSRQYGFDGILSEEYEEQSGYKTAAFIDGKLIIADIIREEAGQVVDENGIFTEYVADGVNSADFMISAYDESGKIYEAYYYNSLNPRTNNPYNDYIQIYGSFSIESK